MSFTIKKGGETVTESAPAQPAVKAEPKAKTKAVPKSELQKLADIICENNPAIAAAKEPKKLTDKARKELLDLLEPDHLPAEEIVVQGKKGIVKFSGAGNKRYCVDPQKVHKILGDDAFYAIIDVKLGELDKFLTPAQLEQVIADGMGSRTMSVLPLPDKEK